MNLDGIRVNHSALEHAAADMQQTVKDIDDRLNRLESELQPLRNDWAGNAQQSYTVAKGKWDTAIQEMKDLLNETHTSVTQSNLDYQAADAKGAAQFGG
ncbi:WXG100 family type VII secretion target [Nocardioides sp.]|uniref:WXG100 family type VII secretion target n=1 Tax=Nocardioides sp. TaxID=35761 RepID=UPI00271B9B87|nr:WXG100 family type VII secretion target [Nocardioides sp.]MDO9457852.1 WXG100 family type VII secretion target [Nocardioides sp.]